MDRPSDLADLPPPVFLRRAGPMPCWTLRDAAQKACGPGDDAERVYNRIKHMADRGLVHTRQNSDSANAPRFLGIDDLGVAVILGAVFDFGVADAEMARTASVACYAWNLPRNPPPPGLPKGITPIASALCGVENSGEFWALMVSFLRDDQTGQRHVQASLFMMDGPPPCAGNLPPSYLPTHTLTVLATPLLMRLTRYLRPARGN